MPCKNRLCEKQNKVVPQRANGNCVLVLCRVSWNDSGMGEKSCFILSLSILSIFVQMFRQSTIRNLYSISQVVIFKTETISNCQLI